ncbi:YdgH/BhsA/McbA-like domain containing protein, partial [Pantoea piersonii]|uniref:YdgH/BhsA/McbA-like domain containing protein n=2 Tax=Erwiniaceae TaxID=1903409 RepID=UPI002FEE29BC
FDTVTFTGHFGTPTEISEEVAKRAADKGAKYYHVTRQWQNQSGGNLTVTADLFR